MAFSSLLRILCEGLTMHSPSPLKKKKKKGGGRGCGYKKKKKRSACAHQFHFFSRPESVHNVPVTGYDCSRVFPNEFSVSSFTLSPQYAWTAESAHSDFVGSKEYACYGVTCHLHFWQNNRGLLRATAVTPVSYTHLTLPTRRTV